ncbi:phospholipid carrier-dependent glycosyltransferase, partial [bacterium]|nr:phospholipid carrier-dependent glycosyltransferase [bacterium]
TSRRVGLLGAGLLAVNPYHISRSQMVEVDILLTLLVVLGLLACARLQRAPCLRRSAAAGALIGIAASVKYPGALLLPTVPAAILLSLPKPGWKRIATWAGAATLAAALAFALTSPYVLLDHQAALRDLADERLHVQMGHFGESTASGWRFYLDSLRSGLLGWPAILLLLTGALALVLKRGRASLPPALFSLVYLAVLVGARLHAERYLLPLWPLALLLIAYAALELPRRIPGVAWRRAALLAAGALLLATLLRVPGETSRLHRALEQDTRLLASKWVAANVPAGSFIVSEQYGPEIYAPQMKLKCAPETAAAIDRLMDGQPYFGLLLMPLFQVMPERTAVFYDLALYRNADYLITSGSVSSRYEREPERFAAQLTFYRQLDAEYDLVQRFSPKEGAGPELRIYRSPGLALPLAKRSAFLPLAPVRVEGGAPTGSEELFFLEMGLLFETLKHPHAALESYRLALRYPFKRASSLRAVVLRAAECMVQAGEKEQAAAFLDDMIRRTATPELKERFRTARAELDGPDG